MSDQVRPGQLRVVVAGVSGWTGAAVAAAIAAAEDLELAGGVARSAAGEPLRDLVPGARDGIKVQATVEEVLAAGDVDVLVDYTSATSVHAHVHAAIDVGVHVVVGSSGLTAADYAVADEKASEAGLGIIAAGNFSLLAALLIRAAAKIVAHVPHREIIDYGPPTKIDAPSGTARELAERLQPHESPPGGGSVGAIEGRGAAVAGTQIHSIRLPNYTLSTEIIFGLGDERLSLRHDPGASPAPYVAGTLLAIRNVTSIHGLVRGIDRWLDA